MSKPRKSLAELAESGTLAKNKGRYEDRINAVPITIHPVGMAPRHLTRPEKAAWAEVTRLAPDGVMTRADRIAVEILVKLLLRVRCTDGKTSEANALLNVLAKFGMDPVSRSRMDIKRAPEPHEIAAKMAEDAMWAELD